MDLMSIWQQHYYTWSTKSLSGNKVGLGIVAASDKHRDSIRIAGTEGGKCEPSREEPNIPIERMHYSRELKGWIRTGSIPSKQGADHRNNRFVHIYSAPWNEFDFPEDYLCPLNFEKEWNGQDTLPSFDAKERRIGRKEALTILNKYNLKSELAGLCYDIYHCILMAEKPFLIVHSDIPVKDFAEFAREMMILIHYLLPKSVRQDADYVSYVTEMSQEAHFLFACQPIGKYYFLINEKKNRHEYTLLEKEFFEKLAVSFLEEGDEFEVMLQKIDQILCSLTDKRNQLEKCILTIMAPDAGKQKEKEDFFTSMERLMYWARKDRNFLKPLEDSIAGLDYKDMEEDDLYSYTRLMLTGAGGETENLVFSQLNHMLTFYYKVNQDTFYGLLCYIRENHGGIYEKLLVENDTEKGFTKEVIFQPIETISDLEYTVKYHKTFVKDEEYEAFVIKSAYSLYCLSRDEKKQQKIDEMAKQVNQDLFVEMKRTDVEAVVNQADSLEEYLHIVSKMNLSKLETKIHEFLYEECIDLFIRETHLSSALEIKMTEFGKIIGKSQEMEAELINYYEIHLSDIIMDLKLEDLFESYFGTDQQDLQLLQRKDGTKIYYLVRNRIFAKRYLELVKKEGIKFCNLGVESLIRFVLKVTEGLFDHEKRLKKEMIQNTKQMLLEAGRLDLLAIANHTLKNYGKAPIHCPESMWNDLTLDTEEEFIEFYEKIEDISLLRCEKSEMYQKVKELYCFGDEWTGTRDEKASYAWKKQEQKNRKKGGGRMADNKFIKGLSYGIDDILSKSIWAVLLGFYGFLFVTIREEVRILYSYNPSVLFLIGLVIIYLGMTFLGSERKTTPGSLVYVMGISVLLMNWGLALDTKISVYILFGIWFVLAAAGKAVHYFLFKRKDDF